MSDEQRFEDTPEYRERKEQFDADSEALALQLRAQLKTRRRDMPKYPDDEDLMKWYNDCKYDLLKWFHRDIEDMRS